MKHMIYSAVCMPHINLIEYPHAVPTHNTRSKNTLLGGWWTVTSEYVVYKSTPYRLYHNRVLVGWVFYDQVRCFASAVKADVQEVTRICPVQHPRAVRFLRRWACERFATLADEILISRVGAALERWRQAVDAMATAKRKQAYLRYQGTHKLLFTVNKAYLRRLAKVWIRWTALVEFERAEERRALEISAAITIQRGVRGLAARRLRAELTAVAENRRRHLAAVVITKCAKGKVARMRYWRLKTDVERVRASEMLRRVGRGMLGRMKAKRLRQERARLKAR